MIEIPIKPKDGKDRITVSADNQISLLMKITQKLNEGYELEKTLEPIPFTIAPTGEKKVEYSAWMIKQGDE